MTIGGLFWYEVVLLVLGVVLFIVLINALRKNLSAGKSYAGLLPFFVLTIAMIGYPSITSIQYNKGMVSIDTDASEIAANPGSPQNAARRQQIQANLSRYESRAVSPRDREIVARARAALKPRTVAGKQQNDSGQPANSGSSAELRERVLTLTEEAEKNRNNAAVRNQLNEALTQLKASGSSDPEDAGAIKRAENFLASGSH
jgi:hypothetical protein